MEEKKMYRVIKFRGKDYDNKWHYGSLLVGVADAFIYSEGKSYKINPFTAGQFTGLKDENNKEIYEGDIVSFEDGSFETGFHDKKGKVVYDDDSACFYFETLYGFTRIGIAIEYIKIISNIYDSPELWKATK